MTVLRRGQSRGLVLTAKGIRTIESLFEHPEYKKVWYLEHPDYSKVWHLEHPDYNKILDVEHIKKI